MIYFQNHLLVSCYDYPFYYLTYVTSQLPLRSYTRLFRYVSERPPPIKTILLCILYIFRPCEIEIITTVRRFSWLFFGFCCKDQVLHPWVVHRLVPHSPLPKRAPPSAVESLSLAEQSEERNHPRSEEEEESPDHRRRTGYTHAFATDEVIPGQGPRHRRQRGQLLPPPGPSPS